MKIGLLAAMASILGAQYTMPSFGNSSPITNRMTPSYGGGRLIFSPSKAHPCIDIDGPIQRARRDRRSRVTTARQQRKARKLANRVAKAFDQIAMA